MNRSLVRSKSEVVWRDRVERASMSSTSMTAFCKSEGVSTQSLSYWQNKFRHGDRQRSLKPIEDSARSPFVGVEVMESVVKSGHPSQLPDAKWVADLIRHLMSAEVRA